MLARLYPWMLVTLFACSIVDDNAITSQEGLKKLKLTGFTIDQQTNKAGKKVTARVISDSTVNITDTNTGTKINRVAILKMPSLGHSKMKLRSGTTADVDMSITYTSSTKPYTMAIYLKDSAVEVYRFRYDATGRLVKIVTIIDPVDNLPELVTTIDTLIYTTVGDMKDIDVIQRKLPNGSLEATIDPFYGGGNPQSLSNFNYKGLQYQQMNQGPGNCNSGTGCGYYSISPSGQGGGSGQSQFSYRVTESFNSMNQFQLEDRKNNNGGSCCRDFDTYYFHPLMVLRNQISKGDYLLLIYMMDWWVPGTPLTNSVSGDNETVTIDFSYGL
jgi:hypothetical protein